MSLRLHIHRDNDVVRRYLSIVFVLLLAASTLLFATPAHAAITFTGNQKTASSVASGDTLAIVLDSAPTEGNTIILMSSIRNGAQAIAASGVSQTGVTWARAVRNLVHSTIKLNTEIWYGTVGAGASATINISYVTVETEVSCGTCDNRVANAAEFSGLATTGPILDTTVGTTTGTSVSPISGTATTVSADALLIGVAGHQGTSNPSAGPTNSFTALTYVTDASLITLDPAYRIVSSAGSYSTGWTITSANWTGAFAAFRPPSTASPVTFTGGGTFSWQVPAGVTSITAKAWGGGGGGGCGNSASIPGGSGGGGGFAQATIAVTPLETLTLEVPHGGNTRFTCTSVAFVGGGGGGYTALLRGSTYLLQAGGGGGGAGHNSGSPVADAGAGGGSSGVAGEAGSHGAGGGGGTPSAGGAGGAGAGNGTDGSAGIANVGGGGGDGTGGGLGGTPGGGGGGSGNGGGGGGGGRFGGGGGEDQASGASRSGGGGGGGSSLVTGTGTTETAGSGTTPANSSDGDYLAGVGVGGAGGVNTGVSTAGGDGYIIISYTAVDSGVSARVIRLKGGLRLRGGVRFRL